MKVYHQWFLARTHMLGRFLKNTSEIYVYKYLKNETELDNKVFPVFNSQIPDHIVLLPGLRFAVTYSRELILYQDNKINRDYRIVTTLFQVPRYELPEQFKRFKLDENNDFVDLKERLVFVKDKNIEVKPLLDSVRKIGQEVKTETCLPALKSF